MTSNIQSDKNRIISGHFVENGKKTPDDEIKKTSQPGTPASPDEVKKKQIRDYLAHYVKKEQVNPIMAACDHIFGVVIEDLTLVTGGRGTSKILQFKVQESPYLLRVTDDARPAFFIDTMSEVKNMLTINDLQVAPKLHHSDAKSGVIIMEYINNVRLTPKMLESENESQRIYRELAQSLRNLHNGPKFTNQPTNIFRNLDKISSEAELSRVPPIARDTLDAIRPLEAILERHMESAPCHLDIHSNNVLYSGEKIYLIDWELSSNCDPFVDLAFATIFFIFDKEKEKVFLENYFSGPPTAEQKAKFFLMQQLTLCLYAFRLLRRVTGMGKVDLSQERKDVHSLPNYRDFILENYNGCSKSFTNEDLKIFPFMFLNQAMKNIQSPQFQESIDILTKQ